MLAQGDDTLATLYLGTSPGMRRIHARTDADDAVYAAEFGLYDAPVKSEDWENKSVLQVPRAEIEKLSLSDLTLSRLPAAETGAAAEEGDKPESDQPGWTAETLAEGETLQQANVDALVDKLAGLNIAAVLGREEKPEYGLEAPALVLSVQRKGGEAIEYRLGKREAEKDYVLKASNRPEYFRLASYMGEGLIKAAARDQLVAAAAPAADTADAPAEAPDTPESPTSEGADEPAQSATQE
jgi:hypothetical protein